MAGYDTMLRAHGRELTAVVAAIADAPDPALVLDRHSADEARLIFALTLLAAGVPIDSVATGDSALRRALDTVAQVHGVEFYLLSNGLGVEHFHTLRERLDSSSAIDRGEVA